MFEKIIEVQHCTGEYNGHSYDNYKLYVASYDDNNECVKVESHKIKASKASDILGISNVRSCIGDEVTYIGYDKYGNINSLELK